jgi:hypothetical protein
MHIDVTWLAFGQLLVSCDPKLSESNQYDTGSIFVRMAALSADCSQDCLQGRSVECRAIKITAGFRLASMASFVLLAV